MAFKLKVVFTGVCAFIPNQRQDVEARMCVVLPDARIPPQRTRAGLDGSPLRHHRGFIEFKVSQLSGIPDHIQEKDAVVIWYLDGHRVTFDYTPAASKPQVLPFRQGSLNELASLELMVPGFSVPDPDVVSQEPPGNVLAQVFLDAGDLRTSDDPERLGTWVFPRSVSSTSFDGSLTSQVILEIPDLEEVTLVAQSFSSGETTRWKLRSVASEEVVVTIANLCAENPLRWDLNQEIRPDEDFRWYYSLLSSQSQGSLVDALRGLPFPIPQPVGRGNGEGRNCVPVKTSAQSFGTARTRRSPSRSLEAQIIQPVTESLSAGARSLRSETEGAPRNWAEPGADLSFLLKEGDGAAAFRADSPPGFTGRFGFRVADARGSLVTLDLTTISLMSSGMETKEGWTGDISLRGLSGKGRLTRSTGSGWTLDAEVDAQVLYREVEERKGFVKLASGGYLPDFETFKGRLVADVIEQNGGLVVRRGTLNLRYADGGLGWIESLDIPIFDVPFRPRAARLAHASCPRDRSSELHTIRVCPIGFRNNPSDSAHSATSWQRQIAAAQAIWGKCCVQFDVAPLIILDNPSLKTSTNPLDIREAYDDPDPRRIEIFMVDSLLPDGGATSFSWTTGLAKIVMSNRNQGNPNLLAHEVGHIFGGLHPTDSQQNGFWVAAPGTVLEPSGSSREANPQGDNLGNCQNIVNTALIPSGNACCISA